MEPPLISLGREKHSQGRPAAPASHMHSSTRSKARSQTTFPCQFHPHTVPVAIPPPSPCSQPCQASSRCPQGLAPPLPPPHMHICQGQFHWHNAHSPKPAKTSDGVLQRNFHFSGNVRGLGRPSMQIPARLVHVFKRLFFETGGCPFQCW